MINYGDLNASELAFLRALDRSQIQLRAYVCQYGEVKHIHDEGFTTITQAFINRPTKCRFCVGHTVDGKVVLIDLFHLVHNGKDQFEWTSANYQEHLSIPAAIMYAVTLDQ